LLPHQSPPAPELQVRVSEIELPLITRSNVNYQLQWASKLTGDTPLAQPTNWNNLSRRIPGDGTVLKLHDRVPFGEPSRLYRFITNCLPLPAQP